ncbi:hypothetical protein B0H14DRAFT_3458992 [Mycena olivaceomarginata]|nr:hypothetical protein B0H14DRAFT_3458992 [Mycena olivaceomarginata]
MKDIRWNTHAGRNASRTILWPSGGMAGATAFWTSSYVLRAGGDFRNQTKCANCPRTYGHDLIYRCKDCFSDALFCQACLVSLHRDNPLHRVEAWTESGFFQVVTLKSLGLRIQLGHGRNGTCMGTVARLAREASAAQAAGPSSPPASPSESAGPAPLTREGFCIVDVNGVHEVTVDFCSCSLAEAHDIQLLRARLYPATITNPATAATFRVLRDYHLLCFEAKASAYHYYNKLARQTNNNGVFQPRSRYAEFRRMTRQWHNLQMFKRAGRGHAADGIAGTKPGECALLCPACPQPGKNLPADGSWRNVPHERRFLYALFLAIDANFRMKRRDVSSEEEDPSLGDGVAFFARVEEYMQHLEKHWNLEQEKSTCVAHDAVDEPDREARGTASSGIGTVDCARHNMKRPNGVGDLQKGERYINMDFMLWRSLEHHDDIVQLYVSYDIVCQWHKNVWQRLAQYAPRLRLRGTKRYYCWLIPKFHLPAHIEACNILFSFNLTPFVAQTDGEAPERGWANANPLASSTKEMGPGARRDALDDHFNDWNHKKILLETELALPKDVVQTWTRAMELWEEDSANPNPFKVTEKHEGVYAIRGRLAAKAATAVAGDAEDDVRGDLHAHEMVDMGIQLEKLQHDLAFDSGAIKLHATDRQKTALQERSNKLGRKVNEWLRIRESFAPVVATLRAEDDQARSAKAGFLPTPAVPVHATQLWLPSKLASMRSMRSAVAVKLSHARYEFELRVGHAHAALEEIRRLLLVRTGKYKYKDRFERGTGPNTRAKTSIDNIDERLRRAAADYRSARAALVNLGPVLQESEWKQQLRALAQDDIRQRPRATFSDPQHKQRKKKRKRGNPRPWAAEMQQKRDEERPASWIWRSQLSAEEEEEGLGEALRIEWAKTRARAYRWTEEVDLVEEEMRRVLEFLQWKADQWGARMKERLSTGLEEGLEEGLIAYAQRQAQTTLALRVRFQENWRSVPSYIALGRAGLDQVPQDQAGAAGNEGQEEEDDDDDEEDEEEPIGEVARDARVAASFVEEFLA